MKPVRTEMPERSHLEFALFSIIFMLMFRFFSCDYNSGLFCILESTCIDGSLAFDVLMNSSWWNNSRQILNIIYHQLWTISHKFKLQVRVLSWQWCAIQMVQVRRGRWQNGEVLSWLDAPRWGGQVQGCCWGAVQTCILRQKILTVLSVFPYRLLEDLWNQFVQEASLIWFYMSHHDSK